MTNSNMLRLHLLLLAGNSSSACSDGLALLLPPALLALLLAALLQASRKELKCTLGTHMPLTCNVILSASKLCRYVSPTCACKQIHSYQILSSIFALDVHIPAS